MAGQLHAAHQFAGYRLKELLHQTSRSTVYSAVAANGAPVVIKTPTVENPTPRDIARYRQAYELARQADARAVVHHLELLRPGASVALVMEDTGALPLYSLIIAGGMRLARWLEIASAMATALGRLHTSGIVHKDLNPQNVVVRQATNEVRLIDLGIAIRLRRGAAESVAQAHLTEGTLAYMSPEQCGLAMSATDHRSDLYSLGVTLFEMATGQVPFSFPTAAELAHAHVARAPAQLVSLRKDFPQVLSDIVARLLSKNADQRYASAHGLAHDLERCATELRRSGAVRSFSLGQVDASTTFRIPDRLYGRDAEREQLLTAPR
jgi:histidine kinase